MELRCAPHTTLAEANPVMGCSARVGTEVDLSPDPCMSQSLFFFLSVATHGNQTDLLAAELNLELIAGLEVQQSGVGLTNQQIAIALNSGDIAELATTLTNGGTTNLDAFGLEKSFVESREVQALAAVFLIRDIATGANDLGFTCIAKLAHLGEKVVTSEHSAEKNLLQQDNHQINPLKRVKQKIGALMFQQR